MTLALCVENLRKTYGSLKAVDDISFDVERGEIFALPGPNGAGKTTSIEVLEGFLRRDGGHVEVLGGGPRRASASSLVARTHRRRSPRTRGRIVLHCTSGART